MSEPIPASGTVHWIGAGLSTGSGLRVVCDAAQQVVLWARTGQKAADRLAGLGLAGRAAAEAFDPDSLAAVVKPGDVIVSMLPAAEHPGPAAPVHPVGRALRLLELCFRGDSRAGRRGRAGRPGGADRGRPGSRH